MVLVDIGTISSRGQVAIPAGIRSALALEEGDKVLFLVEHTSVIVRKVDDETFAALTEPLREARKKLEEEDVAQLVKRWRRR